MNIYEKNEKLLQKEFPNMDSSVSVEDVKEGIHKIKSYLLCRPYATDREDKLKLIRKLNTLIGRIK